MTISSAGRTRFLRPDTAPARWLRAVCAGGEAAGWPPEPKEEAAAVHLARVHHLAARAGCRLAAAGRRGTLADTLIRAWRQSLGDQTLFSQVLGEIGHRATSLGLPLVALKGADLARRIYRPGERSCNDIDLLVPPDRVEQAEELLRVLGFRCDHPDPAAARRHWFALTWRDEKRPRVQIDLHWALGPPGRVRWKLPDVFQRAEPIEGIKGILCLEPCDLLVHLALHAVAFHGATGRWIWWLDLHLVTGITDPGPATARASACGGSVALGAALRRAESFFGATHGNWSSGGRRAALIDALARVADGRPLERPLRWTVAALAVDHPAGALRAALSATRREWGGGC